MSSLLGELVGKPACNWVFVVVRRLMLTWFSSWIRRRWALGLSENDSGAVVLEVRRPLVGFLYIVNVLEF